MERKRKNTKSEKSFNKIIPLVIYPFDVMVSVGESDQELEKVFKRYKKLEGEDSVLWKFTSDSCQGRAAQFSNGALFIRLRHFPETEFDYGCLAHEVFHIGVFLMERIGAYPIETGRNDESCAYVIQYLTQEIIKEIRTAYKK